jgi:hypothetical protein
VNAKPPVSSLVKAASAQVTLPPLLAPSTIAGVIPPIEIGVERVEVISVTACVVSRNSSLPSWQPVATRARTKKGTLFMEKGFSD